VPDSKTYCINGQSVLSNALPGCGSDQVVVNNGSGFICKDGPSNCAAGEFLTFTSGAYGCASTDVPTCGADQVLTFNGSAFICVAKSGSIPSCGANEFLTYNGSTFQCAATQTLTIPSCGSGEVLTSTAGSLACVAQSGGGASMQMELIANVETAGVNANSTFSLISGKKFSDYSAILITTGRAGTTVFIPVSLFKQSQGSGFFYTLDMIIDGSYPSAYYRYASDTTYQMYVSNGAPAYYGTGAYTGFKIWGIK
jgi:hypothetical protein